MIALSAATTAQAQSAGDVMTRMSAEERHAYLVGIVGGLAYSRFLTDRPDVTRMNCVNDWFFTGGGDRKRQIHQWFERHPDGTPAALIYVLMKEECGE